MSMEIIELTKNKRVVVSYKRKTVPYDYGMYRKIPYNDCYNFFDLDTKNEDSRKKSVEVWNVGNVEKTEENFNPKDYVDLNPLYTWKIPRDWNEFS